MAGRKSWDWSPSQLQKLSDIVADLLCRPEFATQQSIAAEIGADQSKVSLAKNGSPLTSVPIAERICRLYDPKRTMEQLLGNGIARRGTPPPFRGMRADIRAGVLLGDAAMHAAIAVARDQPWWIEEAELVAHAFQKRHPQVASEYTAGAWMLKLEKFSVAIVDAMAAEVSVRKPDGV